MKKNASYTSYLRMRRGGRARSLLKDWVLTIRADFAGYRSQGLKKLLAVNVASEAQVGKPQDVVMQPQRFIVPLFQWSYVWNEEDQWEPLWNDVART